MPDVVFSVDQARSLREQAVPGHYRWHPDIPPAATVRPGQSIRVECRGWTDNRIGNTDSANDHAQVDNAATVAYRNAVEYLKKSGYSGAQAHPLLGAAPTEGRISGVVDIPNACASLYLLTAILDVDIRPSVAGPVAQDRGTCAVST